MSDGGRGGGKRRGHEEEHEEHENHERWLVSYADMMTLLMVLFIVMFAISQVDSKKFMALKTGLTAGFGAPISFLDGADGLLDTGTKIGKDQVNVAGVAGQVNADPSKQLGRQAPDGAVNPEKVAELVNAMAKASVKAEVESLKKAEAQLQKALQVAGIAKGATFRFDQRGLVVSIATDKVLFDSGSAVLKQGGKHIIDVLAPTLRKLPNHLNIDGHTDSDPISTAQFPSNWELGSARATAVLRYLALAHRIPFTQMTGSTFADTVPAVPGRSAAAMAADRRVEIVVLARLDDTAGRSLSQLGNSVATGTPGSPDAGTAPDPAPAASSRAATPSKATTASPPPTPAHNLLGPDPTSPATPSAARTATEHHG